MEKILDRFKNGFKIKSPLSNLYLYLEEIISSEENKMYKIGAESNPKNNIWKLRDAGNDYVFISCSNDFGSMLYLTCIDNNNIEPKKFTGEDNQKFYINYKEKGLFLIRSKISKNKYAIELKNNKIGINDKVKQGPVNGSMEQNWLFESIENKNKTNKLKAANVNNNMDDKHEKVVKTVIYKDDECVHTVIFVK